MPKNIVPTKIAIFGKKEAGVTQIARGFAGTPFEEEHIPTLGVEFFSTIDALNNKVQVWELAGNSRYHAITSSYLTNIDIALLCVDLSKPINQGDILKQMDRVTNPKTKIILVGTKADLDPELAKERFDELNALFRIGVDVADSVLTSAKLAQGLNEEEGLIAKAFALIEREPPLSPLQEAQEHLLAKIQTLPEPKQTGIQAELEQLKAVLLQGSIEEKSAAIDAFCTRSKDILNENRYSEVLKAVLTLAAVAAVTCIALAVGFGIGFAAGAWTGPGAFISGLMGASAAAIAVTTTASGLGIATAALASYSIFKSNTERAEVEEAIEQVTHKAQ